MIIPVNNGLEVLIDNSDLPLLDGMKVYAAWDHKSLFWRAVCSFTANGRTVTPALARIILGLEYGDKREAEHTNPNATLDNRRSNLRIATRAQNNANRRMRKDNTSGYKGVSKTRTGRYRTMIQENGRIECLGTFDTPEEAYDVYCAAAKRLHGEFARPERRIDAQV